MKKIKLGGQSIGENEPCFFIAEIGHNHQGNLKVALDMVKTAASCGVNAVKFQKRDNKKLYTKEMYDKAYDNENSFGLTYGEHREFLEFDFNEYLVLKKCAEENNVEFMCTAFDHESVDFLEKLGINSYKIASGDLTNLPLLKHAAKLKKPMFVSTGAATIDEIREAYELVLKYNDRLCLMHTVCSYPAEYENLNLRFIERMKKEFPKAVIGYSGHDNGILASIIACMLGARAIEKHFTINHAWKGTDHKFSLEPEGLRKQVRDIRRLASALGSGEKTLNEVEISARNKMGKSLYAKGVLPAGITITEEHICIKSPGGGLAPAYLDRIIGSRLKRGLTDETPISLEHIEIRGNDGKKKHTKK